MLVGWLASLMLGSGCLSLSDSDADYIPDGYVPDGRFDLMPESKLSNLSRREEQHIRAFVAEHKAASPRILTRLAKDPDSGVRANVAGNANTPQELILKLAPSFPGSIAKNPSAPTDLLVSLAQSPDPLIRLRVAKNPSTPTNTLVQLAKDPDSDVRRCVAGNPGAPSDVLTDLASCPSCESTVAGNPGAPPNVLAGFAVHATWSETVRRVTKNPRTPLESRAIAEARLPGLYETERRKVSEREARERVWALRAKFEQASSRSTNPADLARLSADESIDVRVAVAANPATPLATLLLLRDRNEQRVNAALVDNDQLDSERLIALAGNPSTDPRLLILLCRTAPQDPRIHQALGVNPTWRRMIEEARARKLREEQGETAAFATTPGISPSRPNASAPSPRPFSPPPPVDNAVRQNMNRMFQQQQLDTYRMRR